jgi:hypothetical protein
LITKRLLKIKSKKSYWEPSKTFRILSAKLSKRTKLSNYLKKVEIMKSQRYKSQKLRFKSRKIATPLWNNLKTNLISSLKAQTVRLRTRGFSSKKNFLSIENVRLSSDTKLQLMVMKSKISTKDVMGSALLSLCSQLLKEFQYADSHLHSGVPQTNQHT